MCESSDVSSGQVFVPRYYLSQDIVQRTFFSGASKRLRQPGL